MSNARKDRRHNTMADSLKTAVKLAATGSKSAIAAYGDALAFRKSIFQTGLFEVDVNLRPVFGSRIQLLGMEHQGKSLLAYKMMGAAHHTCRQCMTPIIDFVNDWTGEVVTTCMCGKQDPMRVLLLDVEFSWDPAWAYRHGVNVKPTFDKDNKDDADEIADGVYVTKDATFVLVRGADSDQARIVVENMVRDGSVDLVVIDSLAAINPTARREGKNQIGDQSMAVTKLQMSIVAAQGEAFNLDGVAPTLLMINQYRVKIGGYAAHGQTPKEAAGGWALKYSNSITWDLRSVYNAKDITTNNKFVDCTLTARKDKESGATNAVAEYRIYLDDTEAKGIKYTTGDTDEGNKIYGFLRELGALDPRWFEKKAAKYVILGREFTKVGDIARFLGRRDIGHLLRFPIYAQKFPATLRQHLSPELYNYTPFKDDPILELYEEATKQVGSNVQQREQDVSAVMLPKGSRKQATSELTGDEVDKLLEG